MAPATAKARGSKPPSASSSFSTSPLIQIKTLEAALTADSSDPNPLLPLIALARNDSPQIVHKAVWALHRVFIQLIGEGRAAGLSGNLVKKTVAQAEEQAEAEEQAKGEAEVDGDEEREVKVWVRERLLEYLEILGGLVRDAEPALRSSSVPLLFSLLAPLSASVSPDRPVIHIPYFRLILHYLVFPTTSLRGAKPKKSSGWKTVAANQVQEDEGVLPADVAKIVVDDFWAQYDDIRWAFFKEAAQLIQTSPTLPQPSNLLSQLLPLTNLPKLAEDINTFYLPSFSASPKSTSGPVSKKSRPAKAKKGKSNAGVDALPDWMKEYESSDSESDSEIQAGKKRRQRTSQLSVHASVYSVPSQKSMYTTLWETVFASVPLDEVWTRKILVGLHGENGILGHFKPERRLRIADWLGALVDGGGAMAMLAMNGLFVLITQYNFEYPRFYEMLYGLLDRNVMHVKYRARFFRLLDAFMNGSLMPAAIVASFIKRLSRLALTAPPSGTIIILPFIYNLFKRHPGCMVMLQRQPATEVLLAVSSSGVPGAADVAAADPYDENERSPLKTHAIESSCWELAALQKHYLAPIATLAKVFGEVFTKPEFNMEDFLDHGYGTLFDTEAGRRIKNAPALAVALETASEIEVVPFPGKGAERKDREDVVAELWAF